MKGKASVLWSAASTTASFSQPTEMGNLHVIGLLYLRKKSILSAPKKERKREKVRR
jgi:hypothetical protein